MQHLDTLTTFLNEISLPWRFDTISSETFLPGLEIENGALIIDKEKLLYPGDILHEAGHIAVVTAEKRATLSGNAGQSTGYIEGDEIAAMLWSYAALKHLKLAPEVVFHPAGYKGSSEWMISNFTGGTYMGLPLLEWMGLTYSPKKAKELGEQPFPKMRRWLRE